MSATDSTRWLELGIQCSGCGNLGGQADGWEKNASVPFKLVEDVIRSWTFSASRDGDGQIALVADSGSDEVDWESGSGMRLECMACFSEFALPDRYRIDFE